MLLWARVRLAHSQAWRRPRDIRPWRGPRARILIVEDNPLNRLLVHDLLELRGHAVLEAATVDEARARSRRSARICCCSTCRSRAAAARPSSARCAARRELADLPIVAVTSLAMPGDRERLLSIGFQGYLSKPIDTRTFGAAIEAFLGAAGRARGKRHVRRHG